jgi:hypothetical protein
MDSTNVIAKKIKPDVERQLNTTFNTFEVVDEKMKDNDGQEYCLKIKTDNDGYLKLDVQWIGFREAWGFSISEDNRVESESLKQNLPSEKSTNIANQA